MIHARPILTTDPAARGRGAFRLGGGACWFDRAEVLSRHEPSRIVAAHELPYPVLARLTAPRAPFAGLTLERPRLMGILNVTPDSFSDGGTFGDAGPAVTAGRAMTGADLLDIGGESTRPGAREVPEAVERARVVPAIEGLGGHRLSVDTRKAGVARAALEAGARVVNDVSALRFDPGMAALVAEAGCDLVLMHAAGTPETMQADPRYGNVLLDVYDALAERLAVAVAAGIAPSRIALDPGIGFGKSLAHNLALLRGLALFHGLGCAVLVGASRKRFIGTLGDAPATADRMPGSIAVALAAVAQGVQFLRVHDVAETRQALSLWQAVTGSADDQGETMR